MLKYLANYMGDYEEQLNLPLIQKADDGELVDFVIDTFKSMEVVKNIKFLGADYNTKESTIDMNKHIFRRTKGIPKKYQYKYKMIDDDRCGLLTVHMQLHAKEIDTETGQELMKVKNINKDILIPLIDDNGNMYLNGNEYYLLYQLVEKSTYTTLNSTVIKSLMPIHIIREPREHEDVDGTGYLMPLFSTFVYRRKVPIMMFIGAHFGINYGLVYLKVAPAVKIVPDLEHRKDSCIYFKVSTKCYIEVNSEIFHKYVYVQSVVAGLLEVLTNRMDFETIDDKEIFIKKLTPSNNYEKGLDTLTSFNRMLDETTRKILKLNDYHKVDVYAIIRWSMMEFNALRMKDNMSLENKRLRCFEYVASLLTRDFSERLNQIINLGSKVTMMDLTDIFKFPGNILIQKLHSSGVLRFNDSINDMDFWSKLKWTIRCPEILRSIGKTSLIAGISR